MKKLVVTLIFSTAVCCFMTSPAVENAVFPAAAGYPRNGFASWYTDVITATGEAYDENDDTCAMRCRDFNKYYEVCNLDNGKCVVVRQNNWGPAKYLFNQGRVVDLSKGAFAKIADLSEGLARVSVKEHISVIFE